MQDRKDDERPVSGRVLDEAIAWQLRLDDGNPADEAALRDWLAADPDHARAWRQLAMIDAGAVALRPHAPLRGIIGRPRRASGWKRGAAAMALAAAVGLGLAMADRYQPLDGLLADYRTGTGERLTVTLPDQSVIVLNARSAVDLAFDAHTRAIRLRSGEIHIKTASRNPAETRPFVVITGQGSLRALGTRFLVRQEEGTSWLTVTRSAVLARPAGCALESTAACAGERRVEAGQSLQMGAGAPGAAVPAKADSDAWKDGMLVVDGEPLAAVVAELARYRPGFLQVAPEVAALRVTGTLPLDDGERALTALAASLPVRIVRRGDWWVRIEAPEQ
ncbi:DUF4880 domain-containing protein [Azoarcus indigens]|uniref:FecR family protein n=1 Tax=Azoarcus indigens TaxID=29545 RepID=A0A4R6EEX7_9RHOO|nr:FecR family protein [Azoarcus indigens]NMG67624.1 DUF4880 domain-containing protein [Azoarcus indigens]TDN56804.1 FecR family protein [Azoarcus indigens]